MIYTPTRKSNKKTEYFCRNCQAWTHGKYWNGTGFTQKICDGCDLTLDSDPLGTFELEQKLSGNEPLSPLDPSYKNQNSTTTT